MHKNTVTRRGLLATTVAASVGLAGCGGDGSDPSDGATPESTEEPTQQSTDEPTETASPTPEPAPSLAEFEYPDGAEQSGIDGTSLYQTHESHITESGSITIGIDSEEVRSGDGQSFDESTAGTQKLGSDGIYTEQEQDGVTESLWSPSDEETAYVQMKSGFDTAYRIDNESPSPNEIALLRQVQGIITGVSWSEASEIVEIGDDKYAAVYESTGIADEGSLRRAIPSESISEFSGELHVTSAGYVSEIAYEATAQQGPHTLEEQTTMTFSAVGETVIEPPDWSDTARVDGVQFTTDLNDDQTAVVLEMINGSELPNDARLALSTSQDRGAQTLSNPPSVGDKLYLSLSDSGELLIGEETTPDGATSIEGHARVTIRSKGFQYFVSEFRV